MRCIACGSYLTESFYSLDDQPLSVLTLSKSKSRSINAPRFPMVFRRCIRCGHVFNSAFDYSDVPYDTSDNLMFNRGGNWAEHIKEVAELLMCRYPRGATVIDVGAGDGGLLALLPDTWRRVAFEPGAAAEQCRKHGLETIQGYFKPEIHIEQYQPDIILVRHLLEHLEKPQEFVAQIAHHSHAIPHPPAVFAEVPNFTKGLEGARLSDLLYEHVSNFTPRSLRAMFEGADYNTHFEMTAYSDEVAIWIGGAKYRIPLTREANVAKTFKVVADRGRVLVNNTFRGRNLEVVAFWGGTGKGAAFLNAYKIRYGRVVDSDPAKWGFCVPGTGQEICDPETLKTDEVDTIVITTRWRATDIFNEINKRGIPYEVLLVLDNGVMKPYGDLV